MDRPEDLKRLRRSIELHFNTLVLGPSGSGVTSLINMLVGELEDERGRNVARVSARWTRSSADLLNQITAALGPESPIEPANDALQTAYRRLAAAADRNAETLIVVDDASGAIGHEVFGRLRDELWELGLQWLVSGRADEEAVLLRPPADAFFETVHRLQPMTVREIETLLERRDPDGELDAGLRRVIAEQANGNPARALELARRRLVTGGMEIVESDGVVDRATAQLGRPAARLLEELLQHGPTSPSDDALRHRLGWSPSRAYQVFAELERAGFVTAASEHSGRPGRPRKLFRVVEPT